MPVSATHRCHCAAPPSGLLSDGIADCQVLASLKMQILPLPLPLHLHHLKSPQDKQALLAGGRNPWRLVSTTAPRLCKQLSHCHLPLPATSFARFAHMAKLSTECQPNLSRQPKIDLPFTEVFSPTTADFLPRVSRHRQIAMTTISYSLAGCTPRVTPDRQHPIYRQALGPWVLPTSITAWSARSRSGTWNLHTEPRRLAIDGLSNIGRRFLIIMAASNSTSSAPVGAHVTFPAVPRVGF